MLQQTRASVVVSYFLKWMELFPDVNALAAAPLERVIKAWEGLGYYSRARNLHEGAKQIAQQFGGEIPSSKEALASIPGLGSYTVGAILNFGFAQRAPAVDGNVFRVMSRYLAIEESIERSRVRKLIEEKTLALLDEKEPWISSEALIELGALVCRPMPQCDQCPLQAGCLGLQKGIAESLPIKNGKSPAIVLTRAVMVIEAQGHFLVRKGQSGKVMADLYEFPYFDFEELLPKRKEILRSGKGRQGTCRGQIDSSLDPALKDRDCAELPVQKDVGIGDVESYLSRKFKISAKCTRILQKRAHTFTKYKVWLYPFFLTADQVLALDGWEWIAMDRLGELPFSSGHRTILAEVGSV